MDIGLKIKKLRENRRLSQEELAHQLNISQTKLSNIENGKTKKVGVKMLSKICDLLGVNIDYFLDKKESSTSYKNNRDVCVCVCVCEEGINDKDNFPGNILKQIKLLILDNQEKTQRIASLENELKKYRKK